MTVDIQRAESLLSIAEKCTGHSGKLSNLQSWAIGELIAMNAEIKAEAMNKAKADEAQRAAEAQQKATGLPEEPGSEQDPEDEDPESDHSVDPNLGAPRAIPATELGGSAVRRR